MPHSCPSRFPTICPQRWVDEFIRGLLKLARRYSVTLAGGDTAQSPDGILADIIVLGSVPTRAKQSCAPALAPATSFM